jgi:hypothetical protein
MMKKLVLFSLLSLFFAGTYAQKQGIVTIHTVYSGVVDGYDHINKTVVFIDGKESGESSAQVQSQPNSFSIAIPRGKHFIRVVNMAKYKNSWEEHSIANDYSLDAFYEGSIKLKKTITINLVFDIAQERTLATLK